MRRPASLRRQLDQLLRRLGLADDLGAPRELAVVLALRDDVPLRDVLERLGVDTAPLDLPPPPDAVPFSQIAPGDRFSADDCIWTRATVDQALAASSRPDRATVLQAYLVATQPANAFHWRTEADGVGRSCHAAGINADALVFPVTSAAKETLSHSAPPPQVAWISTDERWPSPGQLVTVDTSAGPVVARLHLTDDAPGGAVWNTKPGDLLDLDDVSHWRP